MARGRYFLQGRPCEEASKEGIETLREGNLSPKYLVQTCVLLRGYKNLSASYDSKVAYDMDITVCVFMMNTYITLQYLSSNDCNI